MHVYSGLTGALIKTLYGREKDSRLGTTLDATEDLDGDGRPDLILGAPGGSPHVGYVEILSTATWNTLHHLEGDEAFFVNAVAGLDDLDGDGLGDFAYANEDWDPPRGGFDGRMRVHSIGPAPAQSFCTAKVNSLGCTPSMSSAGSASLSGADDLHLLAGNVLNQKAGILIWGRQRGGTTFQNGLLCIEPPIKRTPVQFAGGTPSGLDCTGSYDFFFSQAYMNSAGLIAGETVYAQYWSRDQGFSAPDNSGLTDGLVFGIAP